eukprot:TRINITY_DN3947_c0_g1_i1.p1 TRINITY_DN3947_c0_g1~~TRINITY_DN3947_c0_g1_i1.p1  ORF type:complete len:330 (+),score=60.38 TRINITY_DN3947_c0_g1_i1:79-990(+)
MSKLDDEKNETISITIKRMTGKSIPINDISLTADIMKICYFLQDTEGYPVDSGYVLMHKGQTMDQELWLSFYNVQDGDIIHMLNRVRGGGYLPVFFIDDLETTRNISLHETKHQFNFLYLPPYPVSLNGFAKGTQNHSNLQYELTFQDDDTIQELKERDVVKRIVSKKTEAGEAQEQEMKFFKVIVTGNLPAGAPFVLSMQQEDFDFGECFGEQVNFAGGRILRLSAKSEFSFSIPSHCYPKTFQDTVCVIMWLNDLDENDDGGLESTWEQQPTEVLERILGFVWEDEQKTQKNKLMKLLGQQ